MHDLVLWAVYFLAVEVDEANQDATDDGPVATDKLLNNGTKELLNIFHVNWF